MIQLLLETGTELLKKPGPNIRSASLQDCRSRIQLMKALASPSYISLVFIDPIARCFELSKCCRWLASCENELAEHYNKIEQDLEKLASKFVNSVEGSEDIMILLSLNTTMKAEQSSTE